LEPSEEIYRIFFYTAPHLTIEQISDKLNVSHKKKFEKFIADHPNYQKKIETSALFLKKIVKEEYIALRLGKLLVRGLKDNGYPILMQKQVDMLLGLDISHIAYNKLADKVLIFSADTDVIPAIKTARINGLIVVIADFKENAKGVNEEIVKHSDIVRVRSFWIDDNPKTMTPAKRSE
jgi:uncharacterized LabA/DUF88 family protein